MVICAFNFIVDDVVGADHREEWVVRIQGGPQVASLLAAQSDYKHHGPVILSFLLLFNFYKNRETWTWRNKA